jgi:Protein of unknown function (DUF2946)
MDDIVKAALKKWPGVPHCYGWLALDARGDWYMRDDRIQHAGPFPQVKGSRIDHDKLKAFIERNYEADAAGRWFFQNGPQRVYVQLEAAPWVWRLQWPVAHDGVATPGTAAATPTVTSHTGRAAVAHSTWLDDEGRLYLDTDLGFGIVHSQDMLDAAQAVEAGHWQPQPLAAADAPARFGYQRTPAPD